MLDAHPQVRRRLIRGGSAPDSGRIQGACAMLPLPRRARLRHDAFGVRVSRYRFNKQFLPAPLWR